MEVFEGQPGNKVNLAELFKGKKGVLFGVPGAFTPGCSQVRLCPSGAQQLGPCAQVCVVHSPLCWAEAAGSNGVRVIGPSAYQSVQKASRGCER